MGWPAGQGLRRLETRFGEGARSQTSRSRRYLPEHSSETATNHRVNRVTLGSQPASVPSHLQVLTRRVYAPRGPNARASRSLLPLEQSQPAVRCGTAPLQSAPCDTPRLGQSPIPVRVCPVVLPHPPRYFIARTFCIPKSAHRNTFPRRLNGTTTVKHQPPWTTWPKGWEALGSRSLRGHRNSPAVPGRRKTGRFCGLIHCTRRRSGFFACKLMAAT